jgi:hypothetical protein
LFIIKVFAEAILYIWFVEEQGDEVEQNSCLKPTPSETLLSMPYFGVLRVSRVGLVALVANS